MRGLSNAVAGLIVLSFLLVAVMPFVVSSVLSSTSVANLVVVGLGEKLRATVPRLNITLTDTGPPVVYRVENLEAGDVRVAVLVVKSDSGDVLVFRPGGCLEGCVVGNVSVDVDLVRDASARGPEVVMAPGGVFEVRIGGGKLLGVATASGGYAPVYASTVAQFAQEAAVAQSLKGTYFTFSNATTLLDLTENPDVVLTTNLTSDTTNTSILYSGVMKSACYYGYSLSASGDDDESVSGTYSYVEGAFMPYIDYLELSKVFMSNAVVVAGSSIVGGAGGDYSKPLIPVSVMVSAYALAPDPILQPRPMLMYIELGDGERVFCMASYFGSVAYPSGASTDDDDELEGLRLGWFGRVFVSSGETASGNFIKLCWSSGGATAERIEEVLYNMTLSSMNAARKPSFELVLDGASFDVLAGGIDIADYDYGLYAVLKAVPSPNYELYGMLYCPSSSIIYVNASSTGLDVVAGTAESPCRLLVAYNDTSSSQDYYFEYSVSYLELVSSNTTYSDGVGEILSGTVTVYNATLVDSGSLVGETAAGTTGSGRGRWWVSEASGSSGYVFVNKFPYKLKFVSVNVPKGSLRVYYSYIDQLLNDTDAFGFYYYSGWLYNVTSASQSAAASIYVRIDRFSGSGGEIAIYRFVPGVTGGLDPYFFLADTDGNGLTEMIFITEEVAPGYSGTRDDTIASDGSITYVWIPSLGLTLTATSLFIPHYGYASFFDASDYTTPINYIGCQDWSTAMIYLKFAKDFAVNGAQIAQVSVQFRYYFHDNAGDDTEDVENPLNGLFGFYLVDANGTITTSREYIYQELSIYEDTWPPNRNFITDAVYLPVPEEPKTFYVVFGFNDPYGVSQQLSGSGAYNDLEFSVAIEWLGMWLLSR
ncbi:hypothetical protein [Pyrodictium delaneyi]|uniref:hypothetical protein n=1 Tax=Pyrodictium delaneyi TaxID=1273541 RepID=UPI0012E2AC06|nr:hypothetical protein [Pyrodictium delaneyi]